MIRAVAAAFIFVWSGFMNAFIQQTFNGDYSMELWLANLIPCTIVFIAFIINMLFIPSMTQEIFGGAAGMAGNLANVVGKAATTAAVRRSIAMIWYILDILLLRRLGLIRPIRLAILLVVLCSLFAGLIYAAIVFHALSERSHTPHVNKRTSH